MYASALLFQLGGTGSLRLQFIRGRKQRRVLTIGKAPPFIVWLQCCCIAMYLGCRRLNVDSDAIPIPIIQNFHSLVSSWTMKYIFHCRYNVINHYFRLWIFGVARFELHRIFRKVFRHLHCVMSCDVCVCVNMSIFIHLFQTMSVKCSEKKLGFISNDSGDFLCTVICETVERIESESNLKIIFKCHIIVSPLNWKSRHKISFHYTFRRHSCRQRMNNIAIVWE